MSLFTAEEKRRINDYYPALGDRPPGLGSGGLLALIESRLSSVDTGYGASQIGVEDANSYFTADNLEDILDELYVAATTGGSDTITDTPGYYATDTIDGALDALGVALGGTDDVTRNWTGGTGSLLIDDEDFFTSINKLDQGFVDLIAVTNGNGATMVGVEDVATFYAGLTVEAALTEIGTALGGADSTTRDYTSNLFVADDDTILVAISKLDAGIVDGGLAASTVAEVAAGILTVTGPNVIGDVEGGALGGATDDIDTITGLDDGQMMVLRITSAARNLVLKSGTGNIVTPYDFDLTLDGLTDVAFLRRLGASVHVEAFRISSESGGGLGLALASGANGFGASLVGLEDVATLFAVDNVEAALAEVMGDVDAVEAQVGITILANLTTTDQTGLQPAINEVDANADAAQADATTAIADAAAAQAQANEASEQIVPMAVLGGWAIDGDGAQTNGGGMVGTTPTLTEQAVALAKVDNGGVFGNLSAVNAGYTSTYQLFPDVPADNDAAYFGGAVEFCEFALDINVAQASIGATFTPEYWNGAWVALTVRDNTSAAAVDGTRAFERDGAIAFIPPSDWVETTVDGQSAFWVRWRITTVGNIGAGLGSTNGVEHEIVTPNGGFVCRTTGTITTIRLCDNAGTLHTTADVQFILMNYTTGESTAELTFSQDLRCQRYTGLSLGVTAGDVLGVLVTQEDTANEPAGVVLELGITVS